jgi:lysozyme
MVASVISTTKPAPRWTGGPPPPETFDLSREFEGFSSRPYQDSAGVWTIGYGSTRDASGQRVTRATKPVTAAEAQALATRDLKRAADLVSAALPDGLPPRWAAAAILACNNMGDIRVWGPSLLALLRAKRWRAAADRLRIYCNAGGKPLLGLRRRRWCEAAFTCGLSAEDAHERAWRDIMAVTDWPELPS